VIRNRELLNSQFGFRRGRSYMTDLAILYYYSSYILQSFQTDSPVVTTFLDIKIDTVLSDVLIEKLMKMGIPLFLRRKKCLCTSLTLEEGGVWDLHPQNLPECPYLGVSRGVTRVCGGEGPGISPSPSLYLMSISRVAIRARREHHLSLAPPYRGGQRSPREYPIRRAVPHLPPRAKDILYLSRAVGNEPRRLTHTPKSRGKTVAASKSSVRLVAIPLPRRHRHNVCGTPLDARSAGAKEDRSSTEKLCIHSPIYSINRGFIQWVSPTGSRNLDMQSPVGGCVVLVRTGESSAGVFAPSVSAMRNSGTAWGSASYTASSSQGGGR